ncbi:MAG: GntR family transcriptional regulator [Kiritimatiellae bacterium]|nr:GntR family transcriptional regulator [Kiritimatiellia bacterium]
MEAFKSIAVATPESKATQIANQLRERLEGGTFVPGQRIPSRYALAETLGVSCSTVDEAILALVKEGWLARRRGSGTVVRERDRALSCVGVYEQYDYNTNPEATFRRVLCGAIQDILASKGVRMRMWVHHVPANGESTSDSMEELMTACRRGQVQGVIAPSVGGYDLQWFSNLPVPCTVVGADLPFGVSHDMAQGVELGVRELARLGCRSVGWISGFMTGMELSHDLAPQAERFIAVMRELGLTFGPEWVRSPERPPQSVAGAAARCGYELFMDLWRTEPHPEGLIVDNDNMARGVITGLLEIGVRVPEALKLVLHRNREVDLLCPLPASFLDLSIRATAEALVRQIEKQFRGEACEQILLPFSLVRQDAKTKKHGRRNSP